jgi:hypothetical protein
MRQNGINGDDMPKPTPNWDGLGCPGGEGVPIAGIADIAGIGKQNLTAD